MKNKNSILWTFNKNRKQINLFEFSIRSSFIKNGNDIDYSIITESSCEKRVLKILNSIGIENYTLLFMDDICKKNIKNFKYIKNNYYLWFAIFPLLTHYHKIAFFDNDILINSNVNSLLEEFVSNENVYSAKSGGNTKWLNEEIFNKYNLIENNMSPLCNGGVWLINTKLFKERFPTMEILSSEIAEMSKYFKKRFLWKLTDEFFMFKNFHERFKSLDVNYNITFFMSPEKLKEQITQENHNIHFWMRGKKYNLKRLFLRTIKDENVEHFYNHILRLYKSKLGKWNRKLDEHELKSFVEIVISEIKKVNDYWGE